MLATWGDMDYNAHMRNTAFRGKSADLSLMSSNDFTVLPSLKLAGV